MLAKVALLDADKIYSQWELYVGPVEQWLQPSLSVTHMQNHITLNDLPACSWEQGALELSLQRMAFEVGLDGYHLEPAVCRVPWLF